MTIDNNLIQYEIVIAGYCSDSWCFGDIVCGSNLRSC